MTWALQGLPEPTRKLGQLTLMCPNYSYDLVAEPWGKEYPVSITPETSPQRRMGVSELTCFPRVLSVPASRPEAGNMRHWKGMAAFWNLGVEPWSLNAQFKSHHLQEDFLDSISLLSYSSLL